MIGAIAGQQGLNPSVKTPQINAAIVQSASYQNLVSITGSGLLVGVSISAFYKCAAHLRIVVDGVEKLAHYMCSGTTESAGGGGLSLLIPFSTSLLIQIHSGNASYQASAVSSVLLD